MKNIHHVVMFQPRFARKVEAGTKLQTIRLPRKVPVKPGDWLSLREWTGKPYRSKQRIIREVTCKKTSILHLDWSDVMILDGQPLNSNLQQWFAQNDGFKSADEMRQWFAATHTLPFDGVVFFWQNNSPQPSTKPC